MYLQRAGGSGGGIFGAVARRGDDQPVWVGGTDDNPVFIGEYTHTGAYTPARRGDDQPYITSGLGEYTHMGAAAPTKKDRLKGTKKLQAALSAMSSGAFAAASKSSATRLDTAKEVASGFGMTMDDINAVFIAEANRRASGGDTSSGGGGGGLFGTGISLPMAAGGLALLAIVGVVVSRST